MITPKHLIENADKYPDKPALSFKNESGNWVENSRADFYNSTKIISKSLIACGINKNDKVSIYSYNRKEWVECYAALQFINASAVGVYHTCSSSEVDWIVNNSDSKIIFVGNNPGDNGEKDKMPIHRLNQIIDNLNNVELIVLMNNVDEIVNDKVVTWDQFLEKGKNVDEAQISNRLDSINDNDTASIIYTCLLYTSPSPRDS